MNNYEVHEYAEIFPAMSVAELEQLEEDIKAKGLQQKIALYEGKILDGRHRYEICKKLGLEADFQDYNGDDPLGYVVTANLCRRHLSDSQRAIIAAQLVEKGWSSANLRSDKKSEQAASALNVKPRTVESAVNVLKSGIPKLVQAVSSGDVSVSAGEIVAKMPVEEQTHIVAKGKKGIVEAASQVRKTKSDARQAHAASETGEINKSLLPQNQDSSVITDHTLHKSEVVSISQNRNSEPTDSKIGHSRVNQDQVLNFVREALNHGATWIIAGKGTPPEILTDWSILTLKADDDRNKKEPEIEIENFSDASDNREPEIEKSAQSAMDDAEDENSMEDRPNCIDQTYCGPSTEQAKFYLKLINACEKIPANERGFIPIPTLRRFVEDDQFESHLLDLHESGDLGLHPPKNQLEISDEESCLCPPTPDGKFYYYVDMMLKDSL